MNDQRKGSSSTIRMVHWSGLALFAALLVVNNRAKADDTFNIGHLPPAGDFSQVQVVCNNGAYSLGTGNVTPDGPRMAIIFDELDGARSFGTFGGDTSEPRGCIGNEVFGIADTTTDGEHHVWYSVNGGDKIDIGQTGEVSDAYGMNSRGWIVGAKYPLGHIEQTTGLIFIPVADGTDPNDYSYSFRTVTDSNNATIGYVIDVGTLPGYTQSTLFGIDESGTAFGIVNDDGDANDANAIFTLAGGFQNIGGVSNGNRPFDGKNGVIVGQNCTGPGQCLPYYYTQMGGLVNIPTLGGSAGSAQHIDELGNVTGDSLTSGDAEDHNYIFNIYEDMTPTDLTPTLGQDNNVNGISDGEMAGQNDGGGGGGNFAHLARSAVSGRRAFKLPRGGSPVNLGDPLNGNYSTANTIDHGTVGGSALDTNSREFGIVWKTSSPCPAAPVLSCRTAQKSQLTLKDSTNDKKDAIQLKLLKGASTTLTEFGDPTTSTSYTLCVYAGTSASLLTYVEFPAGKGWQVTTKIKGKLGNIHGIHETAGLSPSDANKTKIITKAQGPNLHDATLGNVPLPVVVQFTGNGNCWGTSFSGGNVTRNDTSEFAAHQ